MIVAENPHGANPLKSDARLPGIPHKLSQSFRKFHYWLFVAWIVYAFQVHTRSQSVAAKR
jgi:hypothetical protein